MWPGSRAPILVGAVLLTACSAVDNFSDFRFAYDAGSDGAVASDGGGDGGPGAPGPGPMSAIGDACPTGSCTGGLDCFTSTGQTSFPGGLCSLPCDPQRPDSCPVGTLCAQVDNVAVCLRACDGSNVTSCRLQYSCCASQRATTGPGLCAPTASNFCGG